MKAGPESRVFHYDLFGNLIGESKTDGTFTRDWIYLGSHRLAMVNMPQGGGGIPCGGCALAGGSDGGAIFLLLFGPALIAAGWHWRKRKYIVAGCISTAGAVLLVMHPEAKGQAVNDYIYYYHNDHLGTPKALTDQWQSVFWDADLEPFGSLAPNPSLRVDQPFRFPGQYADNLTGLYYNWNRYYVSGTGRYNRMDPLKAATIYLFKDLNLYYYTMANPINSIDFDGLDCETLYYLYLGDRTATKTELVSENWQYLGERIEGGEGPAFWLVVYCAWMKHSKYKITKTYWDQYLQIYCCTCPTYCDARFIEKYKGQEIDYKLKAKREERFGGYALNEAEASFLCQALPHP